ncbi:hypothetical protein C1A50_2618 [Paenibacillus polymyxa]|nr:hypothetical protein C1A50_2618 [Paenibacillus polymyxa]
MVRIPEGINLDVAAPTLMCWDHNVFAAAPLGVDSGKNIAVVGLGGLGHMAVRFAYSMGAEVTNP